MDIYDNTGLSAEQISYLDVLGEYHQDLAAQMPTEKTGIAYMFNGHIAEMLKKSGVDLDDPRSFAAVIAGATLLQEFMEQGLPNEPTVRATGSLVIGAMLAARPIWSE